MTTAGEIYLEQTPVLRGQAGTQPDLFLRWNAIPDDATSVDVVVHLHGFSQRGGAMMLSEKVPRSGLDFSKRQRPTLVVLPRGNWVQSSWYDFPAMLDGGLDALVTYALQQVPGTGAPSCDRLILTAHSGGGMPAIDTIAGARRQPDELHIFDGLYGRDPRLGDPMGGIDVIDGWLAARLVQEPQRPGALRVVYIERQTGPFSRAVGDIIRKHLAAADPALMPDLARRYRVEQSHVPHGDIAAICGPQLLARSEVQFDWSAA